LWARIHLHRRLGFNRFRFGGSVWVSPIARRNRRVSLSLRLMSRQFPHARRKVPS